MLEPKPKGLRLSSLAMLHDKLKMSRFPLPKSPTGIDGLDEVTGGGLPKGRTTLVCGSAGCGKTLLAMEFLAQGAPSIRRAWGVHGIRRSHSEADGQRPIAGS